MSLMYNCIYGFDSKIAWYMRALTFGCSLTGTFTLTLTRTGFCRNTSRCSSMGSLVNSLQLENPSLKLFFEDGHPASLLGEAAWIVTGASIFWPFADGSFGPVIAPSGNSLLSFSPTCSPLLTVSPLSSAISRLPFNFSSCHVWDPAFKGVLGCQLGVTFFCILLSSLSVKVVRPLKYLFWYTWNSTEKQSLSLFQFSLTRPDQTDN